MRNLRKLIPLLLLICVLFCLSACGQTERPPTHEGDIPSEQQPSLPPQTGDGELYGEVTAGTEIYRGFILDNVYHSPDDGDIHFNLYVPQSYDGNEPYALFMTLPGYEGLYRFGAGANLRAEAFAFEAQRYNDKMIIVAPQLDDWGSTSADQAVALIEYFIGNYNIDENRIYANGYSGGGETLSLVMDIAPELFTAVLHVSSVWDGDIANVAETKVPVYFFIGESDEYYGSARIISTYERLVSLYEAQGLSEEEIAALAVLDVKDDDYFDSVGAPNQHGGGGFAAYDEDVMGWLFSHRKEVAATADYTLNTRISDVISDPAFGDYGRLLFPVDEGYYSGNTLDSLSLTWYTHIDPNKTVEICNYLKTQAASGQTIFYDIYTDAEKAADPSLANTGLFFFRGNAGAPFAVTCAGGGFAYVAAMHDSFPHALELSKRGYNAFAVIYRPGRQTAYEDLARALSFIFENAEELGVDTNGYSLWGGSAGARMAAELGSYGAAYYGGADIPKPAAVVMQYTGHSDYNPDGEPATFACVGDSDGIANWRTMQRRIETLSAMGVPTEFHVYQGLGHGFGLGTGTVAEGWLNLAANFWEDNR